MAAKGKRPEMVGPSNSSLFPCASGVTMPQLGVDDSTIKKHLRKPPTISLELTNPDKEPLDKR